MIKYCHALPLTKVNFHNLLHLDFVFYEKKIALNFHTMANSPPKEMEPTPSQKLKSKIMKYEGWEIFDVSERYFETLNFQERVDLIVNWSKVAK